MITLLLGAVVFVVVMVASAVVLVSVLTWVLFETPGSPWPRLCKSESMGVRTFTGTTALLVYIAIPAWIGWLASSAFVTWMG